MVPNSLILSVININMIVLAKQLQCSGSANHVFCTYKLQRQSVPYLFILCYTVHDVYSLCLPV